MLTSTLMVLSAAAIGCFCGSAAYDVVRSRLMHRRIKRSIESTIRVHHAGNERVVLGKPGPTETKG